MGLFLKIRSISILIPKRLAFDFWENDCNQVARQFFHANS